MSANEERKKVLFCAKKHDIHGSTAIEILEESGCKTLLLEREELPPPDAVAIFGAKPNSVNGRHLSISSHRFSDEPEWAKIPLKIAIRSDPVFDLLTDGKVFKRFKDAVRAAALRLQSWLAEGRQKGVPCPGEKAPTGEIWKENFRKWQQSVNELIPDGIEYEINPELIPKKTKRLKPPGKSRQMANKFWSTY